MPSNWKASELISAKNCPTLESAAETSTQYTSRGPPTAPATLVKYLRTGQSWKPKCRGRGGTNLLTVSRLLGSPEDWGVKGVADGGEAVSHQPIHKKNSTWTVVVGGTRTQLLP